MNNSIKYPIISMVLIVCASVWTTAAAQPEARKPETLTRPPEPSQEEEELGEPHEHEATVTFGKNPISLKAGDFTLIPFLEARFRPEVRANVYGNGQQAAKSLHFVTTRVRLGLDARWKFMRVMMQVQDARVFGDFPGVDDGGSFALHQGILEFGNEEGYVRVGRQEINYGNQRMIGALDWLMRARSFDAVRFHGFFGDKVEVDTVGAMLANQQIIVDDTVTPPVTTGNNGSYLATVNTIYKHSAALRLEGYVLYRHDRPTSITTLPVHNDIVSPGIYVTGVPVDGLKYTGELTAQGGRRASESFFAIAVSGDVQYMFDAKLKPTIYGGFAYATGASEDGKVGEFDNFFPTNHKFYGVADLFGLRNLIDGHIAVGITTARKPVGFKLELFNMALADPSARWSNAPGLTLGQNATNSTRNLGQEIDAVFMWKFVQWASLSGGYAVFIPNQGARNLGHDIATHWGYVMITLRTP